MSFDKNVFVNCPFDDDYRVLLRPLLFTIAWLGFRPRIALEDLDSGTPRIQKIVKLIEASRLAIHDLSRLQAREKGEFYRLNMPLELGIDVGCRLFGKGRHARKRCLILEEQHYRYQAALSDLSGSDIAVHAGSPEAPSLRSGIGSIARAHSPPRDPPGFGPPSSNSCLTTTQPSPHAAFLTVTSTICRFMN